MNNLDLLEKMKIEIKQKMADAIKNGDEKAFAGGI